MWRKLEETASGSIFYVFFTFGLSLPVGYNGAQNKWRITSANGYSRFKLHII